MKDFLKYTLNLLKDRVKYNLNIIHNNEKTVRKILKEPVSSHRSERLNEKYSINKTMLDENNDSIKLQLSIIQFLDKYGKEIEEFNHKVEQMIPELKKIQSGISFPETDQEKPEAYNELTRNDYFDLTIHKGIEFDHQHPYFNDQDFLNDLLEYFSSVEEFEMCSKLLVNVNKNNKLMNN